MSRLLSLDYGDLLRALGRDGWVVVRQKGSHIRLHKRAPSGLLKLTVLVHKPTNVPL